MHTQDTALHGVKRLLMDGQLAGAEKTFAAVIA